MHRTPQPLEALFVQQDLFLHSRCHRCCHPIDKHTLDRKIQKEAQQHFCTTYGFDPKNPREFQRIWKRLGDTTKVFRHTPTRKRFEAIQEAFSKQLQYHGPGRSGPKPEETPPSNPSLVSEVQTTPKQQVSHIAQALLHCRSLTRACASKAAARAIFLGKSKDKEELTELLLQELQAELTNLHNHPPTTPAEATLWNAFLGNVLALLPFCEPPEGTVIQIPTLIEQEGSPIGSRLCDYTTSTLSLPIHDSLPPMQALGLTPDPLTGGAPLLSFMGTTYPGGAGFGTTLLADFTPGKSVGAAVYEHPTSKTNLQTWFQDKTNVHVVGMSLGGALSLRTFCDYHAQIARVDAYSPPGLYHHEWKPKCDYSKVHIWCQTGDLVSQVGYWPKGAQLTQVLLHGSQIHKDPLNAHTRVFTGGERVTLLKLDPEKENRRGFRRLATWFHWLESPFIYLPIRLFYALKGWIARRSQKK